MATNSDSERKHSEATLTREDSRLQKIISEKRRKIDFHQDRKEYYEEEERKYKVEIACLEHHLEKLPSRDHQINLQTKKCYLDGCKEEILKEDDRINKLENEIQISLGRKQKEIRKTRSQLDKALKKGYVLVQLIMCLIVGSAGSGKTCLKCLLLGKQPPCLRCSTPCAERPTRVEIRAVSGAKVLTEKGWWKEISIEELTTMIARALSSIEWDSDEMTKTAYKSIRIPNTHLIAKSFRSILSSFWHRIHGAGTSNSAPTPHVPSLSDQISPSPSPNSSRSSSRSPSPDSSTASSCRTREQSDATKQALFIIREKLVQLIAKFRTRTIIESSEKGSEALFASNWIYFTDSGGQPQFLELFPLFIRNSATLFVIRLSERLDHFPSVEYYRDGKPVGASQVSPYATIDTLRYLVQTMQSRSTEGRLPKIIIVGTHLDKVGECSETIKQKNEKLIEILGPEFSDQLVFFNRSLNQLIFPVNTADPGDHEDRVAQLIRSQVEESKGLNVKVPIWWYILELLLRELTLILGRRVFSKSECLELTKALGFDEEEFEAALKFFDDINVFHYYPDFLPEVVFADSQVPLDKVTELVEFSFLLRQAITSENFSESEIDPMEGKWKHFRDEGVVTLDFLETFRQHYVREVFTSSELILLLKELLIVAPLSDPTVTSKDNPSIKKVESSYFMPSLLDVIPNDQLEQHRVFSSVAAPLLLRFPHGCPRAGVFCCTVVYLMKHCGWEILLPSGEPILVARNCIKFNVLSSHGPPCQVTLIDSFSYIEVHVSVEAPREECTALFPFLQQSILDGIDTACVMIRYTNVEPHVTFFCPHSESSTATPVTPDSEETVEKTDRHTATLTPNQVYWRCDKKSSCSGKVDSDNHYSIWFLKTQSQPISFIKVMYALEDLVNWHKLGLVLGIRKAKLDTIRLDFDRFGQTRQKEEMIDLWLRSDSQASWDKLCTALENVDEGTMAAQIRAKYCV